jgi:hypothetical protein
VGGVVNGRRNKKDREELDQKLLEALDSGPAAEMTRQDWEQIRTTVRQRFSGKAKGGK